MMALKYATTALVVAAAVTAAPVYADVWSGTGNWPGAGQPQDSSPGWANLGNSGWFGDPSDDATLLTTQSIEELEFDGEAEDEPGFADWGPSGAGQCEGAPWSLSCKPVK